MAYFLKNKSHLTIVTIIFIFVLSLTSLDNTSNSHTIVGFTFAGQVVVGQPISKGEKRRYHYTGCTNRAREESKRDLEQRKR